MRKAEELQSAAADSRLLTKFMQAEVILNTVLKVFSC